MTAFEKIVSILVARSFSLFVVPAQPKRYAWSEVRRWAHARYLAR